MNITEKLLQARKLIKAASLKKEGRNKFSKYDYFTPSQVSELVNTVCQELNMLPMFSLKKDEHGLFGELIILDTEPGVLQGDNLATLVFEMRTEMPSITATNMTQQMGGCETYTKRYMLMSAFDITDNNLDFDSQDNRPNKEAEKPGPVSREGIREEEAHTMKEIMSCENLADLGLLWESLSWKQKGKFETIKDNQKVKLTTKSK